MVAGGVDGEQRVAGVTTGLPVAVIAAQQRRVAPAVEEKQGLAAARKGAAHGADEFVAEAAARRCAIHVFQMDSGQGGGGGAGVHPPLLPEAPPDLGVEFLRRRSPAGRGGPVVRV